MKERSAALTRKTRETEIRLTLTIGGRADYAIRTPIPFLNHMLELFAKHGLFGLKIRASGDVPVDDHHLVEDIGIALGQAFDKALGRRIGIRRFGSATLPMDETLTTVAVDFSGRAALVYKNPVRRGKIKSFDLELVEHFFETFAQAAKANVHINVHYGKNRHHVVESIFKAFAKALDQATQIDPRVKGVPSTKGKL